MRPSCRWHACASKAKYLTLHEKCVCVCVVCCRRAVDVSQANKRAVFDEDVHPFNQASLCVGRGGCACIAFTPGRCWIARVLFIQWCCHTTQQYT